MSKKYFLKTFGCAQNLADSEKIKAYFWDQGYEEVKKAEEAEIVVINSCVVRESAENRVYGLVNNLKNKKIIITVPRIYILSNQHYLSKTIFYRLINLYHYFCHWPRGFSPSSMGDNTIGTKVITSRSNRNQRRLFFVSQWRPRCKFRNRPHLRSIDFLFFYRHQASGDNYFLKTFGCAQNLADSEKIKAYFWDQGYDCLLYTSEAETVRAIDAKSSIRT